MVRTHDKRLVLRAGLEGSGVLATVGAHDALSARLVELHGFDAVWVSGFGVSTMAHALPDLNLVTMTEALAAAVRIDGATSLPVVADCDNGFGGYGNVVRTVREYERAGIAGICIEDNVFPKRNSLLDKSVRRELIPTDEQARRLRAAKEARVRHYVGVSIVGIDRFGESAPAGDVFKHFGFTAQNVANTVRQIL